MKRVLTFGALLILFAGCDKDKFQTIPQVEINSITPEVAVKGNFITVNATARDKEGDLKDSLLVVRKLFNGATMVSVDTMRYKLDVFSNPVKSEIDFRILFLYGELPEPPHLAIYLPVPVADRNFSVGLIIRDEAGNKSEYVESNQILLKKL